jgi:hypothetical protein
VPVLTATGADGQLPSDRVRGDSPRSKHRPVPPDSRREFSEVDAPRLTSNERAARHKPESGCPFLGRSRCLDCHCADRHCRVTAAVGDRPDLLPQPKEIIVEQRQQAGVLASAVA